MLLPPNGLTMPVRYRACQAADSVLLSVDDREAAFLVRLADCQAPQPNEVGGLAALDAAELALAYSEHVHLCLPVPDDPRRLLAAYDRPLRGYIFVNTGETLTQHLVRLGHARRTS
jgi:hypothetical protein